MVLKVDTFSVYKPSIGKLFVVIQIHVESERHLQLSRAVPVYSYLVIIVIGGGGGVPYMVLVNYCQVHSINDVLST